jgi:predicted DNA-binding transcriptional regulator YafY
MESSEGWSIDLERHKVGTRVFYRYLDTAYSINNMPLNNVEIELLQDTIQTLTQFQGMPNFKWMQELIPKLREGMQQRNNSSPIMEFDNNPYLKGLEHLEILYGAILNKQVLNIKYQAFNSKEPTQYIIHPYYLKSFNQRWFLFGYNPETDHFAWNLAIDRIEKIEISHHLHYKDNTTIEWKEYFDDIIGVTMPENGQPEKIVIHFHGNRGKYVETKPLHGSQKSRWIDENTFEVKLNLIINKELISILLSYGADLEIVKPVSLRNIIVEQLKESIKQYH